MASDIGREAKDALLITMKKCAEDLQNVPPGNAPTVASALKELAEAYAWLERPIRGTGR
jgi:hypothetical protein